MRFIVISIIIFFSQGFCQSKADGFCKKENFEKISKLHQHTDIQFAKSLFQIFSCEDWIEKKSNRGQLTGLLGGYFKANPTLIDTIYKTVHETKSLSAPGVYMDALWICGTKICDEKLKQQPFSLPLSDVNNLLSQPEPDPLLIKIDSPETIDFMWGYYTGSGNLEIPRRLFEYLKENWSDLLSEESIGTKSRLVLMAAEWSFSSQATQIPEIMKLVTEDNTPNGKLILERIKTSKFYKKSPRG
jgi:hypothetical protein